MFMLIISAEREYKPCRRTNKF